MEHVCMSVEARVISGHGEEEPVALQTVADTGTTVCFKPH